MALDKRKLLLIPVILAIVIGTGLAFQTSLAEEGNPFITKEVKTDSATIMGHVVVKVFDENGVLTQYAESDNLVVDVGLDGMVDRIFGTALQPLPLQIFDFVHIGTGSVFAPNATQTDLEIPLGGLCVRVQDVSVFGDTSVSGETTATIEALFDGGDCAGQIVEAGVFNNATAGTMVARSTFGIVTIGLGDTLTLSYEITIT